MAKVIAKVQGGQPKEIEATTLGDLKRALNVEKYQATINGEPESDDSYALSDYEVITLTEQVKGA